jgi:hypothetical protein
MPPKEKPKENLPPPPPPPPKVDQVKFVKPEVAKTEEVTEEPPKVKEIENKKLGAETIKGDPDADLKLTGDLAEVLVVDTKDDRYYTVDISECFTDNTTIEKYNACCIVNDVIFAMPYGESNSFQTVLVFDTTTETIIKTLDLNEL